jgi:class 3 adenylate cyclase
MFDLMSDNSVPVSRHNSHVNLDRLLGEMVRQPEHAAEISETIDDIFGQEKAVMVLDMCGFSRTTRHHGIVSFLLMMHQMQSIARPCIEAERGLVVKAEADNLFCLFDTVTDAVRAAQEIIQRLRALDAVLPDDRRLYVSIGIGYGHLLNVEDKDLFGDEVNLACKLGEDVGARGQILLTSAAHVQLSDSPISAREEHVSISGLSLSYYSIEE